MIDALGSAPFTLARWANINPATAAVFGFIVFTVLVAFIVFVGMLAQDYAHVELES